MTDQPIHWSLGPSGRHRWGACPGSVREEAKYPEQKSGPAAIDGTHTHTLLEWSIENNLEDPIIMAGKKMSDHEGEFVVDADRIQRVRIAIDYIKARKEDMGVCVVRQEHRVNPEPLLGRPDMSGTVDCIIVSDDMVEIIDYKDGINPVLAKDNMQMEQYAWGVLAEYVDHKFQTIRMTIIQPKMVMKGIDPISSHEVPYDEFMNGYAKIKAQADATDDPDAPLIPGDEQCKYCRAKGGCSALANHAMAASGITFDDLSKQAANKEPTELTDEQLREIMEAAPLIRQMLDGAEAEALRRLKDGRNIAGLKVVKGRGSRDWAFDENEMEEKLKKFGLPKAVIWQTKLISPAQAEKATWGDGKQLTTKQLQMMQSEYIKKVDGKLTVALESDPRPAAVEAAVFKPVLPGWLK